MSFCVCCPDVIILAFLCWSFCWQFVRIDEVFVHYQTKGITSTWDHLIGFPLFTSKYATTILPHIPNSHCIASLHPETELRTLYVVRFRRMSTASARRTDSAWYRHCRRDKSKHPAFVGKRNELMTTSLF